MLVLEIIPRNKKCNCDDDCDCLMTKVKVFEVNDDKKNLLSNFETDGRPKKQKIKDELNFNFNDENGGIDICLTNNKFTLSFMKIGGNVYGTFSSNYFLTDVELVQFTEELKKIK